MSDQNPYSTPDASLSTGSSGTYSPNIFSFNGRIGRLRYLAYNTGVNLILTAIMIPLLGASGMMAAGGDMSTMFSGIGGIAIILFYIATIIISIMFGKRRLNDLNRSGWFALLFIIPIVNLLLVIYMVFFSGTDGDNNYGPQPSPNTLGVKILGLLFPVLMLLGIVAAVLIPAMQ
ncbi:MAG: DUF805 domain-containing protein [Gammaproteobacteria bacterium]|nr:DUF805 domain-containing protein [Gammaproteobacteria bacterium]